MPPKTERPRPGAVSVRTVALNVWFIAGIPHPALRPEAFTEYESALSSGFQLTHNCHL